MHTSISPSSKEKKKERREREREGRREEERKEGERERAGERKYARKRKVNSEMINCKRTSPGAGPAGAMKGREIIHTVSEVDTRWAVGRRA